MTAHIAAHGRLVVDVQSKTISNGNSMAFADSDAVYLNFIGAHNTE